MPYSVGDTVILDGIESVIIYDNGSGVEWGRYIVVDKNHDLCYYIKGDDYVNDETNQWGVEWGGQGIETGVTSEEIGDGLSNTNSLIALDLQPYTEGWPVLWDWVEAFRPSYSDKWFVPTLNELEEIYNQRSYLENLSSIVGYSFYWSSSEDNEFSNSDRGGYANEIDFSDGIYAPSGKAGKRRVRLCRYATDEELNPPKVGDTYTLDGVESVIIYDAGSEQSWGRYILADKNHDLSYYISGSDFSDSEESDDVINAAATYGYEWGGYGTTTGITSQAIGNGLSNTNSLINLNLQPQTSDWRVVWDVVQQFRSTHSDSWFVPSLNELQQVCNQKSFLENLSNVGYNHYWSSSEYGNLAAWQIIFAGNLQIDSTKNLHNLRTRLCRYASLDLLTGKSVNITCSTPSASIHYTDDNSNPSSSSTLYSDTFLAEAGATIKAIGIKEGWLDSDIATYTIPN